MNGKSMRLLMSGIMVMVPLFIMGQPRVVKVGKQQKFHKVLPPGNYSGLTWLGADRYAVVSDKGDDGFYVFRMEIDTEKAKVMNVGNEGFRSTGRQNSDAEGIVFVAEGQRLFLSSEQNGTVRELTIDGKETGRQLQVPELLRQHQPNRGLESLTYDAHQKLFWTVTESTLMGDGGNKAMEEGRGERLRLQSFGSDLMPRAQYAYQTDAPAKRKKGRNHVHGVSELAAMANGWLLVMEREFYVPRNRVGAFVECKLYGVRPSEGVPLNNDDKLDEHSPYLKKTLLCQWKTRMNLLHQDLANYEGMCLGPQTQDGLQTLIMVADSQHQHGGLMRDWFKCIVIGDR